MIEDKINWSIFFPQYLSAFGIMGDVNDFRALQRWSEPMTMEMYPNCLQELYPVEIGRLYGYRPIEALRLVDEILDNQNWNNAIKEYKKQNKSLEKPRLNNFDIEPQQPT